MNYIKLCFTNTQPLKIANLQTSKSGEASTLHYIPGMSLRGAIISQFAKQGDFETNKKILFSDDVCFLNAYPMNNKQECVPSLKGFYEGKKFGGPLKNVVVGEDISGYKRASIGEFCYWENNVIYYQTVEEGNTLNIRIKSPEKKNKTDIFREDYIEKGQNFYCYILCNNLCIANEIIKILENIELRIGSSRSSGYGKIKINHVSNQSEVRPYSQYSVIQQGKVPKSGELYLYCASNVTMRNQYGEICGLDLEGLAEKLQVNRVNVVRAASSLVKISGFQRIWGSRTPEYTMYEAGSVFRLEYEGELTLDTMKQVEEEGIGCGRQEGCGRVVFIRDYENLKKKKEIERTIENHTEEDFAKPEEIKQMSLIATKRILQMKISSREEKYVEDKKSLLEKASKGQKGTLRAFCKNFMSHPGKAEQYIRDYIEHAREKKDAEAKQTKSKNSSELLFREIETIFDSNYFELLNVTSIQSRDVQTLLSDDEIKRKKLELLEKMFEYENRKG